MQALDLIKYALDVYQSCLPTTRFALVRCQLVYTAAHTLLAMHQPGDAMREIENVLKETQVRAVQLFDVSGGCLPLPDKHRNQMNYAESLHSRRRTSG